jgi:release factor glutamine methyltransferase
MSSVRSALESVRRQLAAVTDQADREAESLICHLTGWDRLKLFMDRESELPDEIGTALYHLTERRVRGEPLQYLTGHAGFMDLDFFVKPGVLIPRPDTELLVETAIADLKSRSGHAEQESPFAVIDLGTGSGAIALSIAHYCQSAKVTGVDVSPEALEVASENRSRLALESRVTLIQADMFEYLLGMPEASCDLIVSNPPYIPTDVIETLQIEVREYEPRLALDGGPDGLEPYRRLSRYAAGPLVPGGRLVMEIGFDQAKAVTEFLLDADTWEKVECLRDLQGNDRVVTALRCIR